MFTMTIKSNEYKTFALFHVSILQSYAILVTFKGFPVFEIRKNLDLRKILSTPKIFLKSRFHCIMKMYIVEEPTLKQQQKYYLHAKGQNRTLTSKTILRKRKKNQRSSYLKDFQKIRICDSEMQEQIVFVECTDF